VIGGISYPECRWEVVRLLIPDLDVGGGLGAEIVQELVVPFTPVLEHEAVALCVVGDVFADSDVVRAMDDDAPLVGLPNYILGKCGTVYALRHVKVEGVPSQPSLLTHICQQRSLKVLPDVRSVKYDDMPADHLVLSRFFLAADDDRPIK